VSLVEDQASIQGILTFWFGENPEDLTRIEKQSKLWYRGGAKLDQEIEQRFGNDLQNAILETTLHWAENPKGGLALVVLLDQFSRHIYRRTPRAFAQDPLARAIAMRCMAATFDDELSIAERLVLYHPLHHSESLTDQEFLIDRVKSMRKSCSPNWKGYIDISLSYFEEHKNIIARFGRFPHRNEILGRESTKEELEYLKNAPHYGQ